MFRLANLKPSRWLRHASTVSLLVVLMSAPAFAQTITVTSPNGGETWYKGTQYDLTWTSVSVTGRVKITLRDASSEVLIISNNTANDGTDPWTVPDTLTDGDYYARVESRDDPNVYDDSDATFAIATQLSITVASPNGGESWEVGSTQQITWTSEGTVDKVKIEYSTDGGSSWKTIRASANNTGSYSWIIPDDPSTNCLVRISETDGDPSDVSDNVFTIAPPPQIIVTAPNGGENWEVGSTQQITWTSTGAADNVKIEYSIDNGASWTEIVSSIASDAGSYDWDVPDTPSDECLVKISEIGNGLLDTSDAAFSIVTAVGHLNVVINPQEAIDSGAQWKLKSESTWHDSGETVSYSPSADYRLEFKGILGWSKPSDRAVIIEADQTTNESGTYEKITFVTDKETVTVPEGGTATFQVRLSAEPSSSVDVTVSWESGDTDITVISGSSLKFSTGNWNNFNTVTLEAAEDADKTDGLATIRISDDALAITNIDITATEQDNDILSFITDSDEVTVPEGGTADFNLKLSGEPQSDVNVTVSWENGDSDITIKSGYEQLTFTDNNWQNFQKVRLEAAEDDDTENGQATFLISAAGIDSKEITAIEDDNDELKFVVDKKRVTILEGAEETFKIKLSSKPSSHILVTVSKAVNGDEHISVVPEDPLELTFTPEDWNNFQTVTLAAAEDDDVIDGEAIIQIRAPGYEEIDIVAVEQDNDFSDIYLKLNPNTGTTGNIIKISIEISHTTQEIDAFGLDFMYDHSLFTVKSIKKGSLTSEWDMIGGDEATSGIITVGGVAGGGPPIYEESQGTLVRIWLKVICNGLLEETESGIRIENYTDGIEGFSPEPYTDTITLIPCSRVGDVNGDGDLTPGDAQNALEIYLGKRTPEFCQRTTADSNGDENTTPGDAQDIFECYLGKKELPECHEDGLNGTSSAASFASFSKIRDEKRPRRPSKQKMYALNTIGFQGKTVNIPVIITNPKGILSFSFEVNYLPELLEYTGIKRTQLTDEFDYLTGIEEIKGLVRIEGEGKQPIEYNKFASLAVLAFRVKEGASGNLPITVFNPGKDLINVEIEDGNFLGIDYFNEHERYLSLEKAILMPDNTLRVPVEVSSAFSIKSFGLELEYPKEKLLYAGINRGELTKDFTAVEGNESEQGIVRVGGYSMSGIQERKSGTLVEIVFFLKEHGGKIEIVKLVDDIQDFIVKKRRIRTDVKRDREKKLWFRK